LWAGQVLAATGAEFYMVAVVWMATDLIGRNAGYVSAFQAGALLVGSLLAGVVTDRWRQTTTMVAADVTRAALALILSVAGLAQSMSLPLLVVVAGCVALATAAFDPALQATLPVIATDPALRHATNGLFDATKRMARILGPSMIALVSGILPTSQLFTVAAATFLVSAFAVRAAAGNLTALSQHGRAPRAAILRDSLLGGVRAVRSHPVMVYGLIANLIGNAAWAIGPLLGMVLYLRATSADPLTDYGLMMTAYGTGNLAANLALVGLKPARPGIWLVLSKLIFGLGVFLLPLASDRISLMLVAGVAATNGPFENLGMLRLMQSNFPPHRLAQVYRLQMCAIFSGLLIAYLAAPSLFGWFGLAPVIAAAGAATFVTGLLGLGLLLRQRGRAAMIDAA
jgi:hypothetical protein